VKIVFFGTSSFAAVLLAFLHTLPSCQIIAVVTRPDKPKGRSLEVLPSPVKKKAHSLGLTCPIFQPVKASIEEFAQTLKALEPDLFLVAAYGEIIKQNLLDVPKKACINVHASLLPKYRGAAPIQRAIMDGEKETGITIIEMVLALDAGAMIKKRPVSIGEDDTFGDVEKKLLEAACGAVQAAIEDIQNGCVLREEQDHTKATYASKLSVEEEKIDWNKPAQVLHNQIRALSPYPGAWCRVSLGDVEKRFKIKRTSVDVHHLGTPGEILERTKNRLIVACGKGALQLQEVQLEGKKTMTVQEFLQGIQMTFQVLG
jgi:methionyl-tRNA formyltransferase